MRNKPNIPVDKAEELQRLEAQVKHAEGHDQFDTAHHTMLARLRAELGLIPNRKIEDQKDEGIEHGKQDL